MNPQPMPPQGNYAQPQPPAKSNKKLWIILGLLIGVPTILMGGCVACVALIGMSAANNPKLANLSSASPSSSQRSATQGGNAAGSNTSSAAGAVTMANYERIKNGMSYSQVVQILGKEGKELSSSEIGGYRTAMYQWDGDGWGSNMNVMFQNGKVIQKAQFGLK